MSYLGPRKLEDIKAPYMIDTLVLLLKNYIIKLDCCVCVCGLCICLWEIELKC